MTGDSVAGTYMSILRHHTSFRTITDVMCKYQTDSHIAACCLFLHLLASSNMHCNVNIELLYVMSSWQSNRLNGVYQSSVMHTYFSNCFRFYFYISYI